MLANLYVLELRQQQEPQARRNRAERLAGMGDRGPGASQRLWQAGRRMLTRATL